MKFFNLTITLFFLILLIPALILLGDSYLIEFSQKYNAEYIEWKGLPPWEIYAVLQYDL
jgi:hypothetical protein